MYKMFEISLTLKLKPFNSLHFVELLRPSAVPSLSLSWSKHPCICDRVRRYTHKHHTDMKWYQSSVSVAVGSSSLWEQATGSMVILSCCCPQLELSLFLVINNVYLYSPPALAFFLCVLQIQKFFLLYLLSFLQTRHCTVVPFFHLRVHLIRKLKLQNISSTTQMTYTGASLKKEVH